MLSVSVIGAGGREGVNIIHPPQIPTRKYQPAKSARRFPAALPILLIRSPPPSPGSFPSLLNVTYTQCGPAGDCVKCKIYVTEKYTFVTNGKEN